MSNERIAQLISDRLVTGLTHPGDPETGAKPTQIALPFQTTGQPEEMVNLIVGTTKLLGEALVHLIETEGGVELVDREEAKQMRIAVGQGPETPLATPVHCRCDADKVDPLMFLTITDPERIVIDGPTLIRGLSQREVACPHERKPK